MKRLVFIIAITFIFCLTALTQTDDGSCPQIKINAPEVIAERGENFKISASFENEKSPSDSKFNWLIIKDNKIEKKSDERFIEIDTDDTDKQNRITIVAENPDAKCKNPAFANVIVISNSGSPLILDEYSGLNWNEERVRLDAVAVDMKERKDSELFIWIHLDKKSFNPKSKTKLSKILNYLSTRDLPKNRITFMISKAESTRYIYQPVPNELLKVYYLDEDVMIRGEDLEKISNLF